MLILQTLRILICISILELVPQEVFCGLIDAEVYSGCRRSVVLAGKKTSTPLSSSGCKTSPVLWALNLSMIIKELFAFGQESAFLGEHELHKE